MVVVLLRWMSGAMRSSRQQWLLRYLAVALLCVATGCRSAEDISVDEWWERVVEVDRSEFSTIQHFTIQGIDFSHHFKFEYSDRTDLDAIIEAHNLTADGDPVRLFSDAVPSWFAPPVAASAFSNGTGDPSVVLWIDADNQVAYFELIKI